MIPTKPSKKWMRMSKVYEYFTQNVSEFFTFDDDAKLEMYIYESLGTPIPKESNGYFLAKKNMDITLAMWNEDLLNGLLLKSELYNDPALQDLHWWLEKVVGPRTTQLPLTF